MSGDDPSPERWLLVSDIDDTLTGDDAALAKLADAIQRAGDGLIFAVNSSRPAVSVAETLNDVFPPGLIPDAVITALGTEISVTGKPLASWRSRFDGWPHQTVFDLLGSLGHTPHDSIFQTPRKVSFAVPQDARADARRALESIDCRIIASGTDDFDVVPKDAGKDTATLALADHFNIPLTQLIVAGDSGNDLAMFRAAQNRIAVGNARSELTDALAPATFYHASRSHAAGVHEGLIHFGALPMTETND